MNQSSPGCHGLSQTTDQSEALGRPMWHPPRFHRLRDQSDLLLTVDAFGQGISTVLDVWVPAVRKPFRRASAVSKDFTSRHSPHMHRSRPCLAAQKATEPSTRAERAKRGLRHRTRALPQKGCPSWGSQQRTVCHGFPAEGFQGFFTRPKGVESDVSAGSSASRQSGFPPPLFRSTDGAAAPNLSERRGGAQSTFSANLLPLAFLV